MFKGILRGYLDLEVIFDKILLQARSIIDRRVTFQNYTVAYDYMKHVVRSELN